MYDIDGLYWEMKGVVKNNFGIYTTKADTKKLYCIFRLAPSIDSTAKVDYKGISDATREKIEDTLAERYDRQGAR